MSNLLIESVKNQLTKRCNAGALSNDDLIRIMESEYKLLISFNTKPDTPAIPKVPVSTNTPASVGESEVTQEEVAPEVEEEPLSPTEQKKKNISDQIIALGGTPPEKGALKKFENALAELQEQDSEDEVEEVTDSPKEKSVEESEDTEDEEESEDEIDKFNDLMTEIQELYDKLEEGGKIKDMSVIIDLTQKINEKAQSPDELDYDELKIFHKELKKFDK